MKATNDKNNNKLSLWWRDGGQPDECQNEQQQQQPANHSSDNAETAGCVTPFSHPGSEESIRNNWVRLIRYFICLKGLLKIQALCLFQTV